MNKIIKILLSTFSIYFILLLIGSYLTLLFEQENNLSCIINFQDALWWSLNATSVGNSEVYPMTLKGRIVGIFLILIGYGLFTINVGTISAALMHFIKEESSKFK